jgi:16S rRNA (adenine1518-N6/adenine1519-N6)-dimethyltransferase
MALMFQKEVADRILSVHGSKSYGRLSVLAQAASRPERAFDLPARAFTPPPKVDSSVVLFRPAQARIEALTALQCVTASAFAQRRKMLRQSLKEAFGPALTETLAAAGVDPTARAEELTVETYLDLARRLG